MERSVASWGQKYEYGPRTAEASWGRVDRASLADRRQAVAKEAIVVAARAKTPRAKDAILCCDEWWCGV